MALKSILPHEHYECWLIFVQACRKICLEKISLADVRELDHFLLKFCTVFEQLYGSSMCTPNLYLHCHCSCISCILNFGPGHVFWLFGCERLNGVLGSFPTNHCKIELQMIRKFSVTQHILHASNSICGCGGMGKETMVVDRSGREASGSREGTLPPESRSLPLLVSSYLVPL